MDKNDLKEKILLVSVTAAVFLPLRLVVSQYISDHWIGNFGVATLISITMIILVKKNKLGRFGLAFKNQISKTLWGRSGKFIVAALVLYMLYFGTTILLMDRGNTLYLHDKEFLSESMSGRIFDKTHLRLDGPQSHNIVGLDQIQYLDYLFSISYALLNDATKGWLVNLHLILFIEQVELLGLIWFYKKIFKPAQVISG